MPMMAGRFYWEAYEELAQGLPRDGAMQESAELSIDVDAVSAHRVASGEAAGTAGVGSRSPAVAVANLEQYRGCVGKNLKEVLTRQANNRVIETYSMAHVERLLRWEWRLPWQGLKCQEYCTAVHQQPCKACKTCHFCRQKTTDTKTSCRGCGASSGGRRTRNTGHWCGSCLFERAGQNIEEVMPGGVMLSSWLCPVCSDLCNCSSKDCLRARRGLEPTGQLYHEAKDLQFKSVAHYLVLTQLNGGARSAAPLPHLDYMEGGQGQQRAPIFLQPMQCNQQERAQLRAQEQRSMDQQRASLLNKLGGLASALPIAAPQQQGLGDDPDGGAIWGALDEDDDVEDDEDGGALATLACAVQEDGHVGGGWHSGGAGTFSAATLGGTSSTWALSPTVDPSSNSHQQAPPSPCQPPCYSGGDSLLAAGLGPAAGPLAPTEPRTLAPSSCALEHRRPQALQIPGATAGVAADCTRDPVGGAMEDEAVRAVHLGLPVAGPGPAASAGGVGGTHMDRQALLAAACCHNSRWGNQLPPLIPLNQRAAPRARAGSGGGAPVAAGQQCHVAPHGGGGVFSTAADDDAQRTLNSSGTTAAAPVAAEGAAEGAGAGADSPLGAAGAGRDGVGDVTGTGRSTCTGHQASHTPGVEGPAAAAGDAHTSDISSAMQRDRDLWWDHVGDDVEEGPVQYWHDTAVADIAEMRRRQLQGAAEEAAEEAVPDETMSDPLLHFLKGGQEFIISKYFRQGENDARCEHLYNDEQLVAVIDNLLLDANASSDRDLVEGQLCRLLFGKEPFVNRRLSDLDARATLFRGFKDMLDLLQQRGWRMRDALDAMLGMLAECASEWVVMTTERSTLLPPPGKVIDCGAMRFGPVQEGISRALLQSQWNTFQINLHTFCENSVVLQEHILRYLSTLAPYSPELRLMVIRPSPSSSTDAISCVLDLLQHDQKVNPSVRELALGLVIACMNAELAEQVGIRHLSGANQAAGATASTSPSAGEFLDSCKRHVERRLEMLVRVEYKYRETRDFVLLTGELGEEAALANGLRHLYKSMRVGALAVVWALMFKGGLATWDDVESAAKLPFDRRTFWWSNNALSRNLAPFFLQRVAMAVPECLYVPNICCSLLSTWLRCLLEDGRRARAVSRDITNLLVRKPGPLQQPFGNVPQELLNRLNNLADDGGVVRGRIAACVLGQLLSGGLGRAVGGLGIAAGGHGGGIALPREQLWREVLGDLHEVMAVRSRELAVRYREAQQASAHDVHQQKQVVMPSMSRDQLRFERAAYNILASVLVQLGAPVLADPPGPQVGVKERYCTTLKYAHLLVDMLIRTLRYLLTEAVRQDRGGCAASPSTCSGDVSSARTVLAASALQRLDLLLDLLLNLGLSEQLRGSAAGGCNPTAASDVVALLDPLWRILVAFIEAPSGRTQPMAMEQVLLEHLAKTLAPPSGEGPNLQRKRDLLHNILGTFAARYLSRASFGVPSAESAAINCLRWLRLLFEEACMRGQPQVMSLLPPLVRPLMDVMCPRAGAQVRSRGAVYEAHGLLKGLMDLHKDIMVVPQDLSDAPPLPLGTANPLQSGRALSPQEFQFVCKHLLRILCQSLALSVLQAGEVAAPSEAGVAEHLKRLQQTAVHAKSRLFNVLRQPCDTLPLDTLYGAVNRHKQQVHEAGGGAATMQHGGAKAAGDGGGGGSFREPDFKWEVAQHALHTMRVLVQANEHGLPWVVRDLEVLQRMVRASPRSFTGETLVQHTQLLQAATHAAETSPALMQHEDLVRDYAQELQGYTQQGAPPATGTATRSATGAASAAADGAGLPQLMPSDLTRLQKGASFCLVGLMRDPPQEGELRSGQQLLKFGFYGPQQQQKGGEACADGGTGVGSTAATSKSACALLACCTDLPLAAELKSLWRKGGLVLGVSPVVFTGSKSRDLFIAKATEDSRLVANPASGAADAVRVWNLGRHEAALRQQRQAGIKAKGSLAHGNHSQGAMAKRARQ